MKPSSSKMNSKKTSSGNPTSTKEMLNFSRDHSIEESLNYVALWNTAMGINDEMSVAFKAKATKEKAEFENLLPRKKYLDGEFNG